MSPQNIAIELSKINPGYLAEPLFNQIVRLGVQTALEIVPLRRVGSDIEVCLTKRTNYDPFWPNMYHNPGSVLRPSDSLNNLASAYDRILLDELSAKADYANLYFEGLYFKNITRGVGLGIVCWQEITDCQGEYFSILDLPNNIIDFQLPYIHKCAESFADYLNTNIRPSRLCNMFL